MRQVLTPDRLWAAAILLCGAAIFLLDITPLQSAGDGAAYGIVIGLAAVLGRRAVLWTAGVSVLFIVLAPLVGAEPHESLLQVLLGRFMGLATIGLFTVVILYLVNAKAKIETDEQESETQQRALRQITRLALAADTSVLERFEIITELTAEALGSQSVAIANFGEGGNLLRLYDIWDRRLRRHLVDPIAPHSSAAELRLAMEQDGVAVFSDLHASAIHKESLPFFDRLKLRAIIHVAASYRGKPAGSVIICYQEPRSFTERETAFAKTVSQIVAQIFAMQESKRTVERLDSVSQGIFVLGEDGQTVYANYAARQLAGSADPTPLVPFALPVLHGAGDHHQIRFAGCEYELFRSRLPGNEVLIRIDDVTARNVAMAEAAALEAQLKESAKLQATGQMAAGVAHDFNNILGAITGFAQGLNRKLEAMPNERNFVERILGVCKKGQVMTREILDIARTATAERSAVDLSTLIGNDIDDYQGAIEGCAVLTVLQPSEPLPVCGNAAQLSQLVQNLVVNATHACEGGEGRITVSAGQANATELRQIVASANTAEERLLGVIAENRDYCYLRVADNGHGIPAEVMDRIFEPFFTTKGRRKGSGLGLVVVHGVVNSHHGSCHVRSVLGEGTVFTIYLPLMSQEAVAAQ